MERENSDCSRSRTPSPTNSEIQYHAPYDIWTCKTKSNMISRSKPTLNFKRGQKNRGKDKDTHSDRMRNKSPPARDKSPPERNKSPPARSKTIRNKSSPVRSKTERNKSPPARSKTPVRNKSPPARSKTPVRNKSPPAGNKSPYTRNKSPPARSKTPVRNKSPASVRSKSRPIQYSDESESEDDDQSESKGDEQRYNVQNPWVGSEEKIPLHIKSLRTFVDKPKNPKQKKKAIQALSRASSAVTAKRNNRKQNSAPPPVAEKGGWISYFYGSKDQCLTKVNQRRQSYNEDRESPYNVAVNRSRLKDVVEDSSVKKVCSTERVKSPPLAIPPAYAQLFVREYGAHYTTLQEAGRDIKRKSLSKERQAFKDAIKESRPKRPPSSKKSSSSTKPSKINSRYDEPESEEEDEIEEEEEPISRRRTSRGRNKVN